MQMAGKVAVVTGAGRGIGRAIALRLARAGADVVIGDIDLNGAKAFGEDIAQGGVVEEIRSLGRRSIGVEGDLTQRASAHALVGTAIDKFGAVDVLVNNAGGFLAPAAGSWPSKMSESDLDFMIAANLKSTIFCCQEVLESMRTRGGGSIVNIASGLGLEPAARAGLGAHYGLAKGGVIHFTRTLAAEMGPSSIRVNAVSRGTIATARIMTMAVDRKIGTDADQESIPLRRRGSAEDVAAAVAFFASEDSSYFTGQCLSVCGGRILTPS